MLSVGDGVAIVGVAVTVAVSAFKLRDGGKGAKDGIDGVDGVNGVNGSDGVYVDMKDYVMEKVCTLQHAGIERRLGNIETKIDRLLLK